MVHGNKVLLCVPEAGINRDSALVLSMLKGKVILTTKGPFLGAEQITHTIQFITCDKQYYCRLLESLRHRPWRPQHLLESDRHKFKRILTRQPVDFSLQLVHGISSASFCITFSAFRRSKQGSSASPNDGCRIPRKISI